MILKLHDSVMWRNCSLFIFIHRSFVHIFIYWLICCCVINYWVNMYGLNNQWSHFSAGFSFSCLFLSFFFSFIYTYSSFGVLINSYFSFFNLFIVTFAVVATLVANSKAPPANVVLHPLHFQIPHDTLLMPVYA